MAISQVGFGRQRYDVIPLHVPRIEPDPPGGWLVVHRSYGWAFGSRHEAIAVRDDLAREVQP